eukprot:437621_1
MPNARLIGGIISNNGIPLNKNTSCGIKEGQYEFIAPMPKHLKFTTKIRNIKDELVIENVTKIMKENNHDKTIHSHFSPPQAPMTQVPSLPPLQLMPPVNDDLNDLQIDESILLNDNNSPNDYKPLNNYNNSNLNDNAGYVYNNVGDLNDLYDNDVAEKGNELSRNKSAVCNPRDHNYMQSSDGRLAFCTKCGDVIHFGTP